MPCLDVNTTAQVFIAVGTVSVAILAIWGEKVRTLVAGPRLHLRLRDTKGDLTVRGNGTRTFFYHLRLTNSRTWSSAQFARVLVTGISKRRPDGSFFGEALIAPLQLTWAFPQFHELFPVVATEDTCDLGSLDETASRFVLSTYVTPNNFRGFVGPGESMRVSIVVSAHNFESKRPLVVEVTWNGTWSSDPDEMQRHLVVKEVTE